MNAKDILTNYQNFAVIGVTNNHNKFGYKIFQRLKQLNKTVFGISPIYKDIDGITMYSSLSEVNKKLMLQYLLLTLSLVSNMPRSVKNVK